MKKLFIAALAISAMVACSKDDAPTLDSNHKSITISITNMASTTKAVTSPSPESSYQCASIDDLMIVFCDNQGNQVDGGAFELKKGTEVDGTYTFHGLPETVTQFFVIGSDNGYLSATPTSVAAAQKLWDDSPTTQIDAEVGDIIVFGVSSAFEYKGDCTDPVDSDVKYPLFSASTTVKPNVARVEISSISCIDLGAREYDGNPSTVGFDKLTFKKIMLGTMEQALSNVLNATNPVSTVTTTPEADNNKVWSWNFAGGAVTTYPLSITMDATSTTTAYPNPEHTITTTTYNEGTTPLKNFEKGHIYKMAVEFSEEDLLNEDNLICINVTVTIADWIIHNIKPEFGK